MPHRINYGIDAPVVIRNMLVIGTVLLLCIFISPGLFPPISAFLQGTAPAPGISLVAGASLMYAYAKFGKTRHRDRMLKLHYWKGDEQVLDVGTGLGLLMIGAAKKLTTGRSFGIDIFNQYDLSGNTLAQTGINIELEQNKRIFEQFSMDVQKKGTRFFDTFPPLIIITAIKKG